MGEVIEIDPCIYCAGSGWVTRVDLDGESAYETACPECAGTPDD